MPSCHRIQGYLVMSYKCNHLMKITDIFGHGCANMDTFTNLNYEEEIKRGKNAKRRENF